MNKLGKEIKWTKLSINKKINERLLIKLESASGEASFHRSRGMSVALI